MEFTKSFCCNAGLIMTTDNTECFCDRCGRDCSKQTYRITVDKEKHIEAQLKVLSLLSQHGKSIDPFIKTPI